MLKNDFPAQMTAAALNIPAAGLCGIGDSASAIQRAALLELFASEPTFSKCLPEIRSAIAGENCNSCIPVLTDPQTAEARPVFGSRFSLQFQLCVSFVFLYSELLSSVRPTPPGRSSSGGGREDAGESTRARTRLVCRASFGAGPPIRQHPL